MQPAPELEQEVLRFYEAFSQGDGDLAEQLTSHQAEVVFIGTDPEEWLEDSAISGSWCRRRPGRA